MAVSCSAPPALDVQDARPTKDEYEGAASFEEKKIPGIAHYQRAAVAFAKYRDLRHRQEERKNPLTRDVDAAIPEEVIEQKKLAYLKETQEHLDRVFEVNSDFAMAHQVMGLVHYNRKEYDEAVKSFTEVLRIDPLADNTWVNVAHAYKDKGEVEKAKEAIAEALKINPQNRYALQLREAIENEEKLEVKKKELEGVPPFRPRLDR